MGAPLALSASTHHLFALTLPLLKCVRAILSRVHAPYSPSSFLVFVLLIAHILLVVHPTTASYYQKRAENTTGRFAGAFPSEISAGEECGEQALLSSSVGELSFRTPYL